MRLLPAALLTLFTSWYAPGQSYTISTFAGGTLSVNVPGTSAGLGGLFAPQSIAADAAGNVFFSYQNTVLRLDAITGFLTAVAGNGTTGFSGDNGPATDAQLYSPASVAVDAEGNLYIADNENNRIRRVSNGVITTVAGNGTRGFSGDNGPATSAQLDFPYGLVVDAMGNLYIGEIGDRIRKVANGVITTVAGNGTRGFSGDNGPATSAQLDNPIGIAVDAVGNLYIADPQNNRIREVSGGVINTVAGNGTNGFSGDNGPATGAQLNMTFAHAIAVDADGNLYIPDSGNNRVRKVSNGVITTVAGTGIVGFSGDNGPAINAKLSAPFGVALDSSNNFYILDLGNRRIRKVSNTVIITVAGNGTDSFSGDGGPAENARLDSPSGVTVGGAGTVYIADTYNNRIRMVAGGMITTVAGTLAAGFSGDNGLATVAHLYFPSAVAVDPVGNLYIADLNNGRVRKVSHGVITTVAGNGKSGSTGDNGPATSASLLGPYAVAVDSAGSLYIADYRDHRIRKVSNGVIATVAGNGTPGFSGDSGSATDAQLNAPSGVAVDSAGNLYIADTGNNRIRVVSDGVITTVAGGGAQGLEGLASDARLGAPSGVTVDSAGNLYIVASGRILRVSNGIVTTIAGNGTSGFSGDSGPATSAQLSSPSGITVDSSGNLYVADSYNDRIRLLTPNATSCTYTVSPIAWQAPAVGGMQAFTIETVTSCAWAISGLPTWISVSGASSGTGSGIVTLVAVPNSDGSRSVAITIAGISLGINQAAAAPLSNQLAAGASTNVTPDSQVSAYASTGVHLATTTLLAGQPPWPTNLGGTTVSVMDSGGTVWSASISAVSPGQVNYVMPDGVALGIATVTVTDGDGTVSAGPANIVKVAPGMVVLNAQNLIAANVVRVATDGTQTLEPIFQLDSSRNVVARSVDLGSITNQVFLTLYGTGFRAADPGSVKVAVGGSDVPVLGAGAQGQYPGFDQINIGPLPQLLRGSGDLVIQVTAAGIAANATHMTIQ